MRKAVFLCALTAGALRPGGVASSPALAAGIDTVFVVPGSHLDIGFTAPISQVRDERIHDIDIAIDAAEHDPGFVWFEEGGWTVEAWLDHYQHDVARIGRLRALVMSGRFGVAATLLSAHAAAFPHALTLLTMHLDRIERELGRRPTVAVVNDVPAFPEALVDALAKAGIKYLLAAPNLTLSPPIPVGISQHPFYWESARGNRVLTYLDTDGYGEGLAWGLPPACARLFNARRFPASISDDQVLDAGARVELARHPQEMALTIVQDAFDNWDKLCVAAARSGKQLERATERAAHCRCCDTRDLFQAPGSASAPRRCPCAAASGAVTGICCAPASRCGAGGCDRR